VTTIRYVPTDACATCGSPAYANAYSARRVYIQGAEFVIMSVCCKVVCPSHADTLYGLDPVYEKDRPLLQTLSADGLLEKIQRVLHLPPQREPEAVTSIEELAKKLRALVRLQRRWLANHAASACPLGGIADTEEAPVGLTRRCPDFAHHQGALLALWQVLRLLGEKYPEDILP